MDDLDHSMHIAEDEWTSFYEESEECCLLQPSLVSIDNSSLSDSEDFGGPGHSVSVLGQCEEQQTNVDNTAAFQPNAAGLSMAEEFCTGDTKLAAQVNLTGVQDGRPDDITVRVEEDGILLGKTMTPENSLVLHGSSELCLLNSTENPLNTKAVQDDAVGEIPEVTNDSVKNSMPITEQTEFRNIQCSAGDGDHDISVSTNLKKREGYTKRDSGTFDSTSIKEPETLGCHQGELNSSAAVRPEKERWFVTLTDSPRQQRVLANTSIKKKRRKKKLFRNLDHACSNDKELLLERSSELEINKARETMEERDIEYLMQPYRSPGEQASPEEFPESCQTGASSQSPQIHITSLPFGEDENDSQKLERTRITKTIPTGQCMDSNTSESLGLTTRSEKLVNLPTSTLHDTFTLTGANTKPGDFEKSLELLSGHDYDSRSNLSATESDEKPQHVFTDRLTEKQPVEIRQLSQQRNSCLTTSENNFVSTETAKAHTTQDTEVYARDAKSADSSKPPSYLATNSQPSLMGSPLQEQMPQQSECNKSTVHQAQVEPALTFQSGQRTDITQENNPTSDNATRSSISHVPPETAELREHESTTAFKLSTSGSLDGDPHSSPAPVVPDLMVTPCSVANSSETCIDSLGPTRPVYAISAFWDEMEKLTIRDILQLRVTKSPSPGETNNIQETERQQVDVTDTEMNSSPSLNSTDFLLPDAALVDTSDTADSGYFTHLDDSKPDRSSCEFSTFSDFDEEYLQFNSGSRNPTPDPCDVNQQSQMSTDSLSSTHDFGEEDPNLAWNESFVANEHLARQHYEDCTLNISLLGEPSWPRGMTKSKSMHNVHALNTEVQLKDVPLQLTLENADKSLSPTNCQSTKDRIMKVSDGVMLGTRTPVPIMSNTDILDENYCISFPEVFQYLVTEDEQNIDSSSDIVYNSEDMPVDKVYDYTLCPYGSEMPLSPLQDSQRREAKPIPIFSCSHRTVRDLTFAELDYLFLPQDVSTESNQEDNTSPVRIIPHPHITANNSASSAAAPGGLLTNQMGWSGSWRSLLSLRRIHFPDKGSGWCRWSDAWVIPPDGHKIPNKRLNPAITTSSDRGINSFPSPFLRELAVRQRVLKSIQKTVSLSKKEGLFSTLKQSDMCLVCIAVASWVLKSYDPQAADAWKAALLANVSAVSAIQYLRQYMEKDPPQDKP